jgi:Ca2+-binding EF-hand superfamily protein
MPFAADASVCAALLRTGDRSLEPKVALKWAKKICKALKSQEQTELKTKRPSINTLSLISGIIAVADSNNKNKKSNIDKKANLIFQAFDLMDKGVITETEATILFSSVWRAIGVMSGMGGDNLGRNNHADMERNTKALTDHIRKKMISSGKLDLQLAQSAGWKMKDTYPPSSLASLSSGYREEEVIHAEDFVDWSVNVVGKLSNPKHLPELMFKFNALDSDEYDTIKAEQRAEKQRLKKLKKEQKTAAAAGGVVSSETNDGLLKEAPSLRNSTIAPIKWADKSPNMPNLILEQPSLPEPLKKKTSLDSIPKDSLSPKNNQILEISDVSAPSSSSSSKRPLPPIVAPSLDTMSFSGEKKEMMDAAEAYVGKPQFKATCDQLFQTFCNDKGQADPSLLLPLLSMATNTASGGSGEILTPRTTKSIIPLFDGDGDGLVNCDEFLSLAKDAVKRNALASVEYPKTVNMISCAPKVSKKKKSSSRSKFKKSTSSDMNTDIVDDLILDDTTLSSSSNSSSKRPSSSNSVRKLVPLTKPPTLPIVEKMANLLSDFKASLNQSERDCDMPTELAVFFNSEAFFVDCAERFACFDANESSQLELNEVRNLLIDLFQLEKEPFMVSDAVCREFIASVDSNGNGTINHQDFSKICKAQTLAAFESMEQEAKYESSTATSTSTTLPNSTSPRMLGLNNDDMNNSSSSSSSGGVRFIDDNNIDNSLDHSAVNGEQGGEERTDPSSEHVQGDTPYPNDQPFQPMDDFGVLISQINDRASERDEIKANLPKDFERYLESDEFWNDVNVRFQNLDLDQDGYLSSAEILPVVVEMTGGNVFSLSQHHCDMFMSIFDVNRDGMISKAEYASIVRFIITLTFVGGMPALSDSQLENLQRAPNMRRTSSRGMPAMPTVEEEENFYKDQVEYEEQQRLLREQTETQDRMPLEPQVEPQVEEEGQNQDSDFDDSVSTDDDSLVPLNGDDEDRPLSRCSQADSFDDTKDMRLLFAGNDHVEEELEQLKKTQEEAAAATNNPISPLSAGSRLLSTTENMTADQLKEIMEKEVDDGFDIDVELHITSDDPAKLNVFGKGGQQLSWAFARSFQAKGWFKPDMAGDGEEDEDLDILDAVRPCVLDRVEVVYDDNIEDDEGSIQSNTSPISKMTTITTTDKDGITSTTTLTAKMEAPTSTASLWAEQGIVKLRISGFATYMEAAAFKKKMELAYMKPHESHGVR